MTQTQPECTANFTPHYTPWKNPEHLQSTKDRIISGVKSHFDMLKILADTYLMFDFCESVIHGQHNPLLVFEFTAHVLKKDAHKHLFSVRKKVTIQTVNKLKIEHSESVLGNKISDNEVLWTEPDVSEIRNNYGLLIDHIVLKTVRSVTAMYDLYNLYEFNKKTNHV
ncbi:hypothetical protein [Flavobacterium sp.]|jgi:hypothetical protein|uniref:hypothetical protein n=1 Tax=Flavobacterium sp. TaxID=239 RepID=UPI0037C1A59E